MKVIHLISGGDSGGAKTHVLSLLQNLNKTITAQLVCFRDGPFADEARKLGIPTRICGGNNVLRVRRELSRYIRQEGFELIHCHGSRANMIGAMLRKSTGLPAVSYTHLDVYKRQHQAAAFPYQAAGVEDVPVSLAAVFGPAVVRVGKAVVVRYLHLPDLVARCV